MSQSRIHVVATGGTIASHLDGSTWSDVDGQTLVDELGRLPAQVSVTDVVGGDSASLTPEAMLHVIKAIRQAIDSGADGVVVTHGTDTMEQTAYLADLFLGPGLGVPVVFTGAMRPHSAPDRDGTANMRDAIALASRPGVAAQGVVAVLNGVVHSACELTKVNATCIDAFVSVPGPPAGVIHQSTVSLVTPKSRTWSTPVALAGGVRLIVAYQELEADLVAQFASGASGLVIEVFGALNLPRGLWETVHHLTNAGLLVVLAARPFADGFRSEGMDFLGVVGSAGRSAMKARLALMAAIGSAPTPEERLALLHGYLDGGIGNV